MFPRWFCWVSAELFGSKFHQCTGLYQNASRQDPFDRRCGATKFFLNEMLTALSLKTGDYVGADRLKPAAKYGASRRELLVCPECGEPVHFRKREFPNVTPHFSHYKQLSVKKNLYDCPLRASNANFSVEAIGKLHLQHGQLVQKFHDQFCKELFECLGPNAKFFYQFVENSDHLLPSRADYLAMLDGIRRNENLRTFPEVTDYQFAELRDGLLDIHKFLNSAYGHGVGVFLYRISLFILVASHPDLRKFGLGRYKIPKRAKLVIFISEPFRQQNAAEIYQAHGLRSKKLLGDLASIVLSYVVLRWRGISKKLDLFVPIQEASGVEFVPLPKTAAVPPPLRGHKTDSVGVTVVPPPRSESIDRRYEDADQSQKPALKSREYPLREDEQRGRNSIGPSSKPNGPAWDRTSLLGKIRPDANQQTTIRAWVHPSIDRPKTKNDLLEAPSLDKKFIPGDLEKRTTYSSSLTLRHNHRVGNEAQLIPTVDVSSQDQLRIRSLISRGKQLKNKKITNQLSYDEVLVWAKTKSPLEAFFLAHIYGVPHHSPQFVDPTLTQRLNAWFDYARKLPM